MKTKQPDANAFRLMVPYEVDAYTFKSAQNLMNYMTMHIR